MQADKKCQHDIITRLEGGICIRVVDCKILLEADSFWNLEHTHKGEIDVGSWGEPMVSLGG